MTAFRLEGVIRDYAWGSTTAIQHLLGLPVDGHPAAELWFGAHPDDPSPIVSESFDGQTLRSIVEGDPVHALGPRVADRFGPRLPFLLKVLAAEKALSIQVHPNLEQARAGFAREDAAGVARDAPDRNYRDPNHKPELLCALTPFEALCGFRDPAATRELVAALELSDLDFVSDALAGPDPLRTAFVAVLTHADPAALSHEVGLAAERSDDPRLQGVRLAAADFPGDVGVVLALLLNHVELGPGEAIYLGAGNVHAYLRGTGVEIMANSDNVLRCGLTSKHVDVSELLAVTDFTELADPRCAAGAAGFDVPVDDFRLVRLELEHAVTLDDPGPRIVLCAAGESRVDDVELTAGQAAFVPAAESSVELTGHGLVFVAGTGV